MKKIILITIGIICFIALIGLTYKLFYNPQLTCNVSIGDSAGRYFTTGENNLFLGDNAGENETKISNTLIIKIGSGEIRKQITKKQCELFREMIVGATFYPTTTTVDIIQ